MARRKQAASAGEPAVDRFYAGPDVRLDRWHMLQRAAQAWQASAQGARGADLRVACQRAFDDLLPFESYHAYPGERVMSAIHARLAAADALGTGALVQRVAHALTTRGFRRERVEGEPEEEAERPGADMPAVAGQGAARHYFEVLVVTPAAAARSAAIVEGMRKLRRPQDEFFYEPVVVGTFEDAVLAVLVNPQIQSVLIHEGFSYATERNAALLGELLARWAAMNAVEMQPGDLSLPLTRALKAIRPELDVFLLHDTRPEQVAGDPAAAGLRRVFYEVEEPLEVHLSVLAGVAERYETPYFDNLKKYAQKPVGTFHALPVARGKSIFKSDWIRDMGEFYGASLFLAESSATTGGLDSLLEPTGTIKRAQDMAARAFGADRVFFVTNGTSTSNKMVYQALCAPGDIVIVDRNCHKSHHYGMVLSGAQPYYVEAFPLTAYSMYGSVPLRAIKQALLDLKAAGRLDRVKMVSLTNCTFDGHVYDTYRVMEECLAIKPDLVFLWDEAWFGFARFSWIYRGRTAMGARARLREQLADPAYLERYLAQEKKFGKDLNPKDKRLLDARLVPDPRKVRLRVYETNSTHKSMSSLRQGSMVLVGDEDYQKHEQPFKEAVFTHASTSPNLQIIASLDVARRQMELEGFELVGRSIGLAIQIRREVNQHPLVSKYFHVLTPAEMIPAAYRPSGFKDYLDEGMSWLDVVKSFREDEFVLDPTRLTLVCGRAGFDGTQFKGLLASEYEIQLNKTSRNSVLLQTNINNTRSDVANLIQVLVEICRKLEARLKNAGAAAQRAFDARVRSLMEDVPDLPNFSCFHDRFREDPRGKTLEGDMRSAFYMAYDEEGCEHVPLHSAEIDKRLKSGPPLVSANFVIPYPPGFPIMVPGQVIAADTIGFMRKLDVKEIHGYEAHLGLKLISPSSLGGARRRAAGGTSSKGRKRAATKH